VKLFKFTQDIFLILISVLSCRILRQPVAEKMYFMNCDLDRPVRHIFHLLKFESQFRILIDKCKLMLRLC